jgi:hypothetical protein
MRKKILCCVLHQMWINTMSIELVAYVYHTILLLGIFFSFSLVFSHIDVLVNIDSSRAWEKPWKKQKKILIKWLCRIYRHVHVLAEAEWQALFEFVLLLYLHYALSIFVYSVSQNIGMDIFSINRKEVCSFLPLIATIYLPVSSICLHFSTLLIIHSPSIELSLTLFHMTFWVSKLALKSSFIQYCRKRQTKTTTV